jgi:hypothetical protein
VSLKYAQISEESSANKLFNLPVLAQKKPLSLQRLSLIGELLLSKKPVSAEDQKKKQAYYSKGEKKATAVKK